MDPMILPIAGLLIPVVLVPVVLGLRHARYEREVEHTERMRALELGRTLPQDETLWTPPMLCLTIGAGVPVAVFAFAWLATTTAGFQKEIWLMAGMVGITAVIGGSSLAVRHFADRARFEESARANQAAAKPAFDADAYDVVGTRG